MHLLNLITYFPSKSTSYERMVHGSQDMCQTMFMRIISLKNVKLQLSNVVGFKLSDPPPNPIGHVCEQGKR